MGLRRVRTSDTLVMNQVLLMTLGRLECAMIHAVVVFVDRWER